MGVLHSHLARSLDLYWWKRADSNRTRTRCEGDRQRGWNCARGWYNC